MERNDIHNKGVAARKEEKARVKHIKELMKQNVIISDDILTPIEDSEVICKATDPIWKAEEAKKDQAKTKRMGARNEDEDEDADEAEVSFITDTIGDDRHIQFVRGADTIRLQKNFVGFEVDEDDEDDKNGSGDKDERMRFRGN